MKLRSLPATIFIVLALGSAALAADDLFEIQVVDDQTGRGVPLVVLETTNSIRYVTDSAGRVAFHEPGLMGKTVFVHVRSHGYEFPADGFGIRGARLIVEPGGKATIKIHRINIAERLYRVTGGGIYRDSILLGYDAPIENPLLNAEVLGCDSVMNVIHNGKLHWFWGDTNQPAYPLGNFHTTGAVSALPDDGGLDPNVGVNFDYYIGEDGFVRPVAKMPGSGPTWIDAVTALTNKEGEEHIYGAYTKIEPPLTAYARGLMRFNDDTGHFEKIAELPLHAPILPGGHPFKQTIGDAEYLYFAKPYPLTRVEANPRSYQRLADYEAFTCLVAGSTLDDPRLDRTEDGTLRYSWKQSTPPLGREQQQKLIESGELAQNECITIRDHHTGEPIVAHGGSVYWNDYRGRWIMIFVEIHGTPSLLGEVWYAEADSPVGPWGYAVKIATHDRYDFYNPKQHPAFDQDGGKTIFFEGTYTNTFSGNPIATPRYNYNQIMHKLRLDDPRMILPVAIYHTVCDDGRIYHHGANGKPVSPEAIAFFALDRPTPESVPIYQSKVQGGMELSTTPPESNPEQAVAFYALPAKTIDPPATTEALYRSTNMKTGEIRYITESMRPQAGFKRDAKPLCLVWKNPINYTWVTF